MVAAAAATGPVGWALLGIGGALVVSYEYGWSPTAATNREALIDAVQNAPASINAWIEEHHPILSAAARTLEAVNSDYIKGYPKTIANHLHKMSGGEAQFPGMPPLDPKDYKDARSDGGTHDHWLNETNTALRDLAKDNPNSTLEQLLQQKKYGGYSAKEAAEYVDVMARFAERQLQDIARMSKVDPRAVQEFTALLKQLGVTP